MQKMLVYLKKFWKFVWEEDSILSWVVNIALAFVIIKFLLYPGLGLAFQTDHPVVAVVSGSMEHNIANQCVETIGVTCVAKEFSICGKQADQAQSLNLEEYWQWCGDWYDQRGITQDQFSEFSFANGFNKGDIMVLYGTNPDNIVVGDVIVFMSAQNIPIIHRVVNISQIGTKVFFETKGDHNGEQISVRGQLNELAVSEDQYIGRAVMKIPFLGWVKILATDILLGVLRIF